MLEKDEQGHLIGSLEDATDMIIKSFHAMKPEDQKKVINDIKSEIAKSDQQTGAR